MISRIGKIWHYDFTIDGRRYRGSCATEDKRQAQAFASQRQQEAYAEQRLGATTTTHMTIGEAFARYRAEISGGTAYGDGAQRHHMAALAGALGAGRRLADLDDAAVSKAIGALRAARDWGPAATNRHLATLQAVCRRARETWGVSVGPWQMKHHRLVEPPGREVFLDYDQARSVVANIIPHARRPVLLDLLTGLRKANLLGLRQGEVSLDLGRAVLRQKGNRRLSVPLVPAAIEILAEVWVDGGPPEAFVFTYGHPAVACPCAHCLNPANWGKPIRDIRQALATAAARADLGHLKLRFHDLRHTFASMALAETGNLMLVQEMLGHADIKTTRRYAHLLPGAREKAAMAIGNRLAVPAQQRETA